ncbi:MAG: 2-oxoacid:acceptor oxidoreductase family protein, partial [Actinobacteria bacterium]|nr:2-oxoacid:acceptor oxidoreductase family protein [Actinomycetota bacterium]
RGAPVRAYNRIATEPLLNLGPVRTPDVVVVLDETLVESGGVREGLQPGALVIVNSATPADELEARVGVPDVRVLAIDADAVAMATLGRPITKIPPWSGRWRAPPARSIWRTWSTEVRHAFAGQLPPKAIEGNVAAVRQAFDAVRSVQAGAATQAQPAAGGWSGIGRSNGHPAPTVDERPGWTAMPRGGQILAAGSAEAYVTGTWRTEHPVFTATACTHCLLCWPYCPDVSILVKDGKVTGLDYAHCKGCGVCEQVCPRQPKAIVMQTGMGPLPVPTKVTA